MRQKYSVPFLLSLILLLTRSIAFADVLTIDAFRKQVLNDNVGVRGQFQAAQGAEERSAERKLLLSPNFFANGELFNDRSEPVVPIVTQDRIRYDTYQLGISQTTPFGLTGKIYYDWRRTEYINAASPFAFPTKYYQTQPVLELTQPLWGNGFGRGVKAQQQYLEAEALNASYAARYEARTSLADAEAAYWRLSVERRLVAVQRAALDQAKAIYEWTARRVRLSLADDSDGLQAEASIRVRELELQQALDDEREASEAFNTARHVTANEVPETLEEPDVLRFAMPTYPQVMRDDVRAAKERSRLTEANAVRSIENNRPTLEAYTKIGFSALRTRSGDALTDPVTEGRRSETVGLRLSVPLDAKSLKLTKNGYSREKDAAEQIYAQKLFEQERDWQNLSKRLAESQRRMQLSRAIEDAQKRKVEAERSRLKRGRSTTYQVLLFEQDYSQSQLTRLRAESEVLGLLTQTKLYGDAL